MAKELDQSSRGLVVCERRLLLLLLLTPASSGDFSLKQVAVRFAAVRRRLISIVPIHSIGGPAGCLCVRPTLSMKVYFLFSDSRPDYLFY